MLYRHVLRNSLIPMVTILGLVLPVLLAGSLVTEQVFNYPGMGLLFYQEAVTNDYPVLLGITLVVGVATVLGQPARRHRLRVAGPAGEVRMTLRPYSEDPAKRRTSPAGCPAPVGAPVRAPVRAPSGPPAEPVRGVGEGYAAPAGRRR